MSLTNPGHPGNQWRTIQVPAGGSPRAFDTVITDTPRSPVRERLPALRIGGYGQRQEWLDDYDEPQPGHRHTSHLFALHPGNQITVRGTPQLAADARISLERHLTNGRGATGWSRAWIVNFGASGGGRSISRKPGRPVGAVDPAKHAGYAPAVSNRRDFGGAAGTAEMLLQSRAGEISILPALPKAWPDGSVSGLRARGGVEVDIAWKAGVPARVTLRSTMPGELRVRLPGGRVLPVKQSAGVTRVLDL